MPRTIYTERDIEEIARRGTKEIRLSDDVYLTDIARERAEKLGITLTSGAHVRESPSEPAASSLAASPMDSEQIINKVKADVIARLGGGVDAALIERIVRRVVSQLK